MSTPQTGICADNNLHARFVTLLVKEGGEAQVREAAARLPQLTEDIGLIDADAGLTSAIGFGSAVWNRVYGDSRPAELRVFPALEGHGHSSPSTPGDVFIHIRSDRQDLNFMLLDVLMISFGDAVEMVEQTEGFRYLDSRDLTGFVDGTENPDLDERPEVALVSGTDPMFAGGSYGHVQRYVHKLGQWNQQPVHVQEATIGRTKDTDEELDDDIKPDTAHISRVVIEEDGDELEIVRQSLPWGKAEESGLVFVAYCFTPERFERMLSRMIEGDDEGNYDHLMDYTRAVTGGAFFMPSVEFLQGHE